MLRKAFAIIMIFAVSAHTGGEAFLYFWYLIGNGSFEKAFCINQERPELQCHGKCHLAKLAREEQEQKQPQTPSPVSEEERLRTFYIEPEIWTIVSFTFLEITEQHLFKYDRLFSQLLIHTIFHPPK